MTYELYGIGNPVMDVLAQVTDEELEGHKLVKGTFNLLSAERVRELHSAVKEPKLAPGGSVANSIALFAQLGGKAFFCGKVGTDQTAKDYKEAMQKIGVDTHLPPYELPLTSMTGTNVNMITPDCERTMAVHLGSALQLKKEDVDIDALKKSKVLHVGGYVLEDPDLRSAVENAMIFAKANGIKISLDCADPALVERCKEDMQRIVKEYADIVFANEDEAKAITGEEDPYVACEKLSKQCEIAVVKMGKNGSVIRKGMEVAGIDPVSAEAVDTTGAGDAYAGAFLYAFMKSEDIVIAGNLASYMAAKVVETMGARLEEMPEYKHVLEDLE